MKPCSTEFPKQQAAAGISNVRFSHGELPPDWTDREKHTYHSYLSRLASRTGQLTAAQALAYAKGSILEATSREELYLGAGKH